jgi:hypothetical protein
VDGEKDGGQERGHGRRAGRPHPGLTPTAVCWVRLRWPTNEYAQRKRRQEKETAVCWGTK